MNVSLSFFCDRACETLCEKVFFFTSFTFFSHAFHMHMKWSCVKRYEYCVKTTTISPGISLVWCVNLSDRACETLCEKDNIFHTLFHIVLTWQNFTGMWNFMWNKCEKHVNTMWKLPLFHTLFHMVFHICFWQCHTIPRWHTPPDIIAMNSSIRIQTMT